MSHHSHRVTWLMTLGVLLVGCEQTAPTPPTATTTPTATAKPTATAASSAEIPRVQTAEQSAFRDAAIAPPKDYTGPRFKLSADSPQPLPAVTAENAPWLKVKVDFGD